MPSLQRVTRRHAKEIEREGPEDEDEDTTWVTTIIVYPHVCGPVRSPNKTPLLSPHRRYAKTNKDRLYYGQEIVVQVTVAKVGTSSCTYDFQVRTEEGVIAVSGTLVVVHASSTSEGSAPWPSEIRAALLDGRVIEVRSVATEA